MRRPHMIEYCVLWAFALVVNPAASFVHDLVLPHHEPKDCTCAVWSANTSSTKLWANNVTEGYAGCAMPALALTPDLALRDYAPQV